MKPLSKHNVIIGYGYAAALNESISSDIDSILEACLLSVERRKTCDLDYIIFPIATTDKAVADAYEASLLDFNLYPLSELLEGIENLRARWKIVQQAFTAHGRSLPDGQMLVVHDGYEEVLW